MIITDADGLSTARITIDVDGFAVPAYTARPREGSELPVVLVLSETYGLHPHIQDVTRRFAHEGFFAVAPDLMARQGDPAAYDDVNRLVVELLQHIPDEQVMADLDGVLEWAVTHGGDPARATVNGFSWGGRWAWLFAAHSQALAAAVSWYGVLDDTRSGLYPDRKLFPHHPIELADQLKTPTLGLYAAQDKVVTIDTVEAMKAAVAARPSDEPAVEFTVYPDAGHGFHADYRDDYDKASALDGWRRAVAWLRRNDT
jgi:carboxymethylenebutenolidase